MTYDQSDLAREYYTPASPYRPEHYREPFQRDYARVLHSASFRRLQGKTQLFPTLESDFFRSRLTHSLEVSQIATAITRQINYSHYHYKYYPIDEDVVSLACIGHDIGHPPFGHNGEEVLDTMMRGYGGFEGNAQTLRMLSRIEKKYCAEESEPTGVVSGVDHRKGLGLSYRAYASILKYDTRIPGTLGNHHPSPCKGYYKDDEQLVANIRSHVGVAPDTGTVETVECSIMDLADDIAYSMYDLEDALKGGFLTPYDLVHPSEAVLAKVTELINQKRKRDDKVEEVDVAATLYDLFSDYLMGDQTLALPDTIDPAESTELAYTVGEINRTCKNLAESGYFRTQFTSHFVGYFVRDVEVRERDGDDARKFSSVALDEERAFQVDVLKMLTYASLIMSPQFRVVAHRSRQIVRSIFTTLTDTDPERYGPNLLPPDVKELYHAFEEEHERMRVVSDYVAGMTDRYALEFYGRLFSENPATIFKPM